MSPCRNRDRFPVYSHRAYGYVSRSRGASPDAGLPSPDPLPDQEPGARAARRARRRHPAKRPLRQTGPPDSGAAAAAQAVADRVEAWLRRVDDIVQPIEFATPRSSGSTRPNLRTERLLPMPGIAPTAAAILLVVIGGMSASRPPTTCRAWPRSSRPSAPARRPHAAATSPSRALAGC